MFLRDQQSFLAPFCPAPPTAGRRIPDSKEYSVFVKCTLAAVAVLASLAATASIPAQAEAPKPSPVVVGQPLAQAHAHNDYDHDRLLLDALEHGFTSVEADVWLVDGELLVAHDLADAKQGVTLESLYLDPLQEMVRSQPGHSV